MNPKPLVLVTFFALVAVALALLCPYNQVIAPDWQIQVVDENGKPLADVAVLESWQQYSLEEESHEETLLTSPEGRVHFPLRSLRSNDATRFAGVFHNIVLYGAHASWGPHAWVVTSADGLGESWAIFLKNAPQEKANHRRTQYSNLTLMHCPAGHSGLTCRADSPGF